MSDVSTQTDRDTKTGRFQKGSKGGPGRVLGSRNKLGSAFLEDLRDAWNELGPNALRRCAEEEPGTFCKIVSGLLPKSIDINVAVDVADFATRFTAACAMLGNDAPRQARRPLPGQKVIEHNGG